MLGLSVLMIIKEFYENLKNFIIKYKEIPYETDMITILLYMMGLGISNRKKDSLNSAICTELVSKYLNELFDIRNRYIYPKNYAIEYKNIFKEKNILNDQFKIYDAEVSNYIMIASVIIIILIIGAICIRSYSLFSK